MVPSTLLFSVLNTPMLSEVSTTPSTTSLLRITPFGNTLSRLITFCVQTSSNTFSGFSIGCRVKSKLGPAIANSSFNKTANFSTALCSSASPSLKQSVAKASRGIALRTEPPRISPKAKEKCGLFLARFVKKRANNLMALALPV